MTNRRAVISNVATGLGIVAVAATTAFVMTRGENPPPPTPPRNDRQARLDKANAELAQARAQLERLQEQQFKAMQAQLTDGAHFSPYERRGDMTWHGRRALDAPSDPKVQAILKARGITNPDAAYDLFPYQWQVDLLHEEPDAPKR